MGMANRRFLLEGDDTIRRLADSAFQSMLAAPASHRLLGIAGQHMSMANLIVDLFDRPPLVLAWTPRTRSWSSTRWVGSVRPGGSSRRSRWPRRRGRLRWSTGMPLATKPSSGLRRA